MKVASKANFVRAGAAWVLLLVLLGSIVGWFLARDPLPEEITLITGAEGGLYHHFGLELKSAYERRTGHVLNILPSGGSAANRKALLDGRAEIAIVQAGAVPLSGIGLLSALYPEVVHFIVRRDSGVDEVQELVGKRLILGALDSGMRRSALDVLSYYDLAGRFVEHTNGYFTELLSHREIDGAIVTTGIFNPDLQALFEDRTFQLLPLKAAGAIQLRNAYMRQYVLPLGTYDVRGPIPPEDLPGLATTALLVGRHDLPDPLIRSLLESIYEGGLRYEFPSMFRKEAVVEYAPGPFVREAELYFNPADRIGQVANIMESIAAFKELVFALFAGMYLLWGRFRRFEEREKERSIQREKDKLDELLTETLTIEEAQVGESDPERLTEMLNEVTRIKLKALRQLTHEDLRGDRVFLIFLTQCANLIGKIEAKLNKLESSRLSKTLKGNEASG